MFPIRKPLRQLDWIVKDVAVWECNGLNSSTTPFPFTPSSHWNSVDHRINSFVGGAWVSSGYLVLWAKLLRSQLEINLSWYLQMVWRLPCRPCLSLLMIPCFLNNKIIRGKKLPTPFKKNFNDSLYLILYYYSLGIEYSGQSYTPQSGSPILQVPNPYTVITVLMITFAVLLCTSWWLFCNY